MARPPAGNSIWLAVVWCVVLIAVFAPLAVAQVPQGRGAAAAEAVTSPLRRPLDTVPASTLMLMPALPAGSPAPRS